LVIALVSYQMPLRTAFRTLETPRGAAMRGTTPALPAIFLSRIDRIANLAVRARTLLGDHEALELAQNATQSSAAAAIQQMSTRFASGAGALASLLRERQDLDALMREQAEDLAALMREQRKALRGEAPSNPDGWLKQASVRAKVTETEGRLKVVAAR